MEKQLKDILSILKSAHEGVGNITRKDKDMDTRRFLLNTELNIYNLMIDIAEQCGVELD